MWVSVNGAAENPVFGGASGSQVVPWIITGYSYRFTLYAGSTHSQQLAQVTVTRSVTTGTITASPNPAINGTTTITFDGNGNGDTSQVYVSMDGGTDVLLTTNPSGVVVIPWIVAGHTYTFTLYAGQGHLLSGILGSVNVTGT